MYFRLFNITAKVPEVIQTFALLPTCHIFFEPDLLFSISVNYIPEKKWVMALDDKKASVLLVLVPSVQLTTWYIFNQEPRLLCVAFEPIN